MTSIRTRCWAGAAAILLSVLLVSVPATVEAEPAHIKNNADPCILNQEGIFYGRSKKKCPKNDWFYQGCREDGCCCKDACSEDCRISYCKLKVAYRIDPYKYCDESIECKEEWTCRPGADAAQ